MTWLLLFAAFLPSVFPPADESLTYAVKWPSGLSLGEAHLSAIKNGDQWTFDLTVDASLPGFAIRDHYRSQAGLDLCSTGFIRETLHGSKRVNERIEIDRASGRAVRSTVGGGKTEMAVESCAHDPLDLVFLTRRELVLGKLPPALTVLFGAGYPVRLENAGVQTVKVNDVPTQAERVVCTIKLPKSDFTLEMFFARDAARTPVVIRAPFAIGTFGMELTR